MSWTLVVLTPPPSPRGAIWHGPGPSSSDVTQAGLASTPADEQAAESCPGCNVYIHSIKRSVSTSATLSPTLKPWSADCAHAWAGHALPIWELKLGQVSNGAASPDSGFWGLAHRVAHAQVGDGPPWWLRPSIIAEPCRRLPASCTQSFHKDKEVVFIPFANLAY